VAKTTIEEFSMNDEQETSVRYKVFRTDHGYGMKSVKWIPVKENACRYLDRCDGREWECDATKTEDCIWYRKVFSKEENKEMIKNG